jgi:hypothetical protein
LRLSITLMIAATDGAAVGERMCSQFFLPKATGQRKPLAGTETASRRLPDQVEALTVRFWEQ